MRVMKRVLVTSVFLSLFVSAFNAVTAKHASYTGNSSEKTFQELQNELNKEKFKRKVVSRFEVIEGLRGLNVDDISLTLLNYSYHFLNDSGRRQPFVTVQCRIDISRFEKDAKKLKAYLQSTGRPRADIQLPDSERTILGLIDDVKDEFITLASIPKWAKAVVKFAELRKNKPEYIILTLEPAENCTECDLVKAFSTAVFGFDKKNKAYEKIMDLKTYREVDVYDDLNTGYGYIDKSIVSWSDWINNEYRELIISTERETLGPGGAAKAAFKNKKEIYSWVNDKKLALVERIVDGKSTMSRRGGTLSAVEVELKDGELYEKRGKAGTSKITSTDGEIHSYLVSPNKHYVAYSTIAGYHKVVGLDGDGDARPVFHIVVMDLSVKKQLTEIKPQSKHEPFIYADRWISNDELLLTDADGFAVGWRYVYNAGTNELRRADIQEMNL